jgi:hypothetical protein
VQGGAVIEPDKDQFLDAARRLAAKDRKGLADPEDMAIELGIGLYEVTELVFSVLVMFRERCGRGGVNPSRSKDGSPIASAGGMIGRLPQ